MARSAWKFLPMLCLVLAIPNLLLACSLFLALATATRSMNGCLIGAVGLLTLYGLQSGKGSRSLLFEPFGFVAAETLHASDAAPLIGNRALWLGVALALVGIAVWLDGRTPHGAVKMKLPNRAVPGAAASCAVAATHAHPRHTAGAALLQLLVRTRHHVGEMAKDPTFWVLLLLGLASCLANLWPAVQSRAPLDDLLVTLIRSFALVPVIVVLFFAGEIHWNDRTHRIDQIVGATPAPHSILLLAQVASLGAVLLMLALATGLALPALLVANGRPPDLATVLLSYVLPKAYDWLLLGIFAWLLQTLSSNKFAGWGYFVLFLIATLAMEQIGLTNPTLHFGRYPGAPVPPVLSGEVGAQGYRAMWGVIALLFLAVGLIKKQRPPA